MGLIRLYCPNCGRILGDTDQSIDANINCRGCKTTQRIIIDVKRVSDFYELNIKKEEE